MSSVGRRPVVAIIGTCDTKLEAMVFIKHTIISDGKCEAIILDIGSYEPSDSTEINISRRQILGESLWDNEPSRGAAMKTMTEALTRTLSRLHAEQSISGVIGAGGSGNTSVCTTAFRDALPIGFPKLMVSTMASGDVSHYVGETDITMMYSVVDIAGMNNILEIILGNAARAIAGMVSDVLPTNITPSRPTIAISMFGVTTPCVQTATKLLERLGYVVVVFHATGAGGKAMERLISEGNFVGVLDLTTTELADELVGGVLTAGPLRLEAAAKAGIPQVVSVGALDMVNFGPSSTVPDKFEGRLFHEHNASVTLMRTTRDECTKLGEILARKVGIAANGMSRVILPLKGISLIDVKGAPFYDAAADQALFLALKNGVRCPVLEVESDINDPTFAKEAVRLLHEMITSGAKSAGTGV